MLKSIRYSVTDPSARIMIGLKPISKTELLESTVKCLSERIKKLSDRISILESSDLMVKRERTS
jgi:hypothetical protein